LSCPYLGPFEAVQKRDVVKRKKKEKQREKDDEKAKKRRLTVCDPIFTSM
jgi:hypothetical protein